MFDTAPQLVSQPIDRSQSPVRLVESQGYTNDVPGTYAGAGLLVFSQLSYDVERRQFDCCRLFSLSAAGAAPPR
jgi:hypothetical protein